MHPERVEPHPQHRFEVGAEILVVVDADTVQEIRPWKQAAGRKAGRCFPRAICRGERELSRSIERVTLPVDPEDHALSFEEIEDGIQQRLFARSGEDERIGVHGNGIALGSPILAGFHDHQDLLNPGGRPLTAGQTLQAAPELGEGKTTLEAPLAVDWISMRPVNTPAPPLLPSCP